MTLQDHVPYRGQDRRSSIGPARLVSIDEDRRRRAGGVRARSCAWAGGLLVVAAALALVLLQRVGAGPALAVDVQRLAAVLAVVAATLAVVRWTLTGEAAAVLVGAALGALALGPLVLAPLARLLHDGSALVAAAPLSHAVVALPAVVLLARALRAPVVDSTLRPSTALLQTGTLVLGAALLLLVAAPRLRGTTGAAVLVVVSAVTCAAWATLAVLAGRGGPLHRLLPRVRLVLGLLGVAELLRLVAPLDVSCLLLATVSELLAAGVAAVCLGRGLGQVLRQGGSQGLQLLVRLRGAERRLQGQDEDDEVLRHDVRATLAGVRAALSAADRYGAGEPGEVRAAVVAELHRVEHLLGARRREPVGRVVLADALAALVATERAQGARLEVDLGDLRVHAAPDSLVRAVQNLLANARRHAPGARVALTARPDGDVVRLEVTDDGPGVPAGHGDLVLVRGVRAGSGAGQGLGLHSAAELVAASGGTLRHEARPGGGATFVLLLPAAQGHDDDVRGAA